MLVDVIVCTLKLETKILMVCNILLPQSLLSQVYAYIAGLFKVGKFESGDIFNSTFTNLL